MYPLADRARRVRRSFAAAWRRGRRTTRGQRGMLLVAVVSTLAVMAILSGVLIQDWSIIERREREAQLLFIQEQYAAAIAEYQKGQGALPTTLEQLMEKGQKGEFYLRRPYTDPMIRGSKLEDWCLLRLVGTGQVSSSCADESGDGSALPGEESGERDRFAGGRKRFDSDRGSGSGRRLGENSFGNDPGTPSGLGQLGEESPAGRQRNIPGLAAGTSGIVGVHSKSTEQAFNTMKRDGDTYDQWHYTVEDYKRDVSQRNIPGMPAQSGPGLGKPGQGTPGTQGGQGTQGSGFGQSGSRFGGSSGFGGSDGSTGGSGRGRGRGGSGRDRDND